MRLSTVFELLLIFLLIAFAAYGRVIERDEVRTVDRAIRAGNGTRGGSSNVPVEVMSLKQATENVNKYCTCDGTICNCCRNFNIPIVQLKGPGCASLQYLEEDKLAVQLSVGDNILTSTVVNGQKPKAVCFPMPGGLTKFCGRIYSIQREADKHFKACLGLELQSSTELEAALRVSCFRFGPDGVKLRPAEQLPIVEAETPAEEDDDDDFFGLGDDDDDDDEEEDEDDDEDAPEGNAVPDSSATANNSAADDDDDDDDDDDVLGFGALIDILTGDDESDKKKKKPTTTANPILPFTIPIITKPTTDGSSSLIGNNGGPGNSEAHDNNAKPIVTTPVSVISQSAEDTESSINDTQPSSAVDITSNSDKFQDSTEHVPSADSIDMEQQSISSTATEGDDVSQSIETTTTAAVSDEIISVADTLNEVYVEKPEKQSTLKKVSSPIKTISTLTSNSINAIDIEKPKPSSMLVHHKPSRPKPAAQTQHPASHDNGSNEADDEIFGTSDLDDDDDDDDDDDKIELEDDSDEDEEDEDEDEDEKLEHVGAIEDEKESDKDEEEEEEDDEDDDQLLDDDAEEEEEEEAVLASLVQDDKLDEKIKDKVADNEAANPEEDDADYGLGLAELLSRKRHMTSGRRSKVMRLFK